MGEAATANAQPSATTMVEVATSNRVIRNICNLGSNTSRPHGSNTSLGDICNHNKGASGEPVVQSLGQLGEITSPAAVPERSASPAETTTSGRRSVALAPAAHVSTVRREGAFPRRVRGNSEHSRTSAAASSVFGTIFRSPCRAARLLPSSPVDIARVQGRIFDRVKLRTSAATRQLCIYPTDATTAQT